MKKVVICVIELIILVLIATNVMAATRLDTNINISEEDIKVGQEVAIIFKLNPNQEIEEGINSYKATLEYDESVFEQVVQNDFTNLNGWERLRYNPKTGEFVAIKRAGTKVEEEVVKVTLKVKSTARTQETEVKIKDIVTSDGKEDIQAEETKVKINIIKEELEEKTNEPETTNHGNTEIDKKDNLAPSKIPKTGDTYIGLFILLAIEIFIIIAYISRKKGKNIEKEINKRTKMLMIFAITGLLSIQLIGTIYAVSSFISKGELNGDKEINYIDVNLLELHLINQKYLPEDKLENADMNSDGEITVTDLTLLIRKIENTLQYEVILSDLELENLYPNKNEEVSLKFMGDVSYDANIKKVIINGQEYEVQKTEGSINEYTFKINTGNVGGIKEYHFTEVLLDNEKKVLVDYTLKIDVLKEMPKIENYNIEEDINEQKIKLSFNLVDKDNSINSAILEIFNEAEEVIQEQEIIKGQNNIEVAVEDGKKYKAVFVLRYDLDSNELMQEEDHSGIEQISKDLQMIIDYKFEITNIESNKQNTKNTIFEKNEPIQISFNSKNATKFVPETIKVNGKEYSLQKQDSKYTATIDGITELGEKEIIIEEVTLENGKKFVLESDNKVKINVIKQKPAITNFIAKENIEEENIKVGYTLNDEDKSIKNATVILLDGKGNEIQRQDLSSEEIEKGGQIEKTLTTKITDKYEVKIIATYNQTGLENEDIVNSVLFEQEIKAEPRATITQVETDKDYIEKGEKVTITYDIETNKIEEVSKICINNVECNSTKIADGKYKVTLEVSKNSGIQEITATKIIYSDDTVANVNKTVKVDILKDIPNIKNFKQQDNIEQSKVTLNFTLIDKDNSFGKGKAVLIKQADNKIQEEKEIKPGENSIDFQVENAKMYTLEVKATYDRDTNTLEGKPQEDNNVMDEVLVTKEIQLLSDYELQLYDIKTYKNKVESKYFKKNEGITLKFESTNVSKFVPEIAVINGKEYNLKKTNNIYETTIDSFAEAGVKDIIIEKIILNNSKELEVTENNQTKIEILKDAPTVKNFGYKENDNGTITTTFQIVDEENTNISGKVIVYNQNGTVAKQENITKGMNTVEFILNASENEFYKVKVLADYDLDTNTLDKVSNNHNDIELLDEIINVGKRLIEMKDIKNIELYRQTEGKVKEVTNLNEADLKNLNDYIVKVNMEQLDSFYATIKEYRIENNEMKFVLDYDDHVQYIGNEKNNKLEVTYGIVKDEVAENQNLQELIEAIRANPNGNFELYKDYDLSGITILDDNTVFTGTLNGNGHTLSNLTTRLFNKTEGATIENLVIMDFDITAYGALINESVNTTIRNVHEKNATVRSPNANGTGSLIGTAKQGSIIENCSATNINVGSNKRTGGMIGMMYASTIRNCYITGRVNSGNDAAGGVIGEAFNNSIIENLYADITTNYSWTDGSIGGLIGNPVGITLTNCISLAKAQTDGHGKRVYGSYNNSKISGASKNVYELSTSNMKPNKGNQGIQEVTEETLKTKEFYTKTLKWDENIWDMSNVANGEYPTLKSDPILSAKKEEEKPNNADIYIPDYSRIHKIVNYDEDREIAYYNMYKLMPFYDAKYYIEDGNKIAKDHILNTKKIKHIFPYDKNGKWIGALSQKQKDSIKTIRILFTDDDSITYNISFKEDTGKIASYKIDELDIEYNYNKYLINTDSQVYKYIVNQTKTYDYVNDIATITQEEEVRNYTENYTHVKENADKFALYLLANTEEYNVSIANSVLEDKLIQDLSTDDTLKRLLYAYNYFDRFYNIEIGGINMTDIAYFDGSVFNDKLNATITSKSLVERASSDDRKTSNLTVFYNKYISPYTGKNIGNFLEYFMQNLTTEKYKNDPASWIIDNYDGTVYEAPAQRFTEIRYRVWDHLKARDLLILPLLSYHGGDMYILGIPTCVMVGNLDSNYYLRQGFHKNKFSDVTKEERIAYLKSFADKATVWYDSIAGIINENGYNNMKNRTMISYDNTSNKNWSNDINVKPAYKGFFEVLNKYTIHGAASAYANGTDIYWIYDALQFYNIYSHEALHNQDGNTFLEGTGRRSGANAEYFTDGFLTQSPWDCGVIPNYTFTLTNDSNYATNLTPERINTREKIGDYYSKMFDTFATLDYIEAKAFLQLTPEEQSKVASVIVETEGYNKNLSYTRKTAEDFKRMNLKTIEDLWDNKIVIRRGGTSVVGGTDWYLVHNDNGLVTKDRFVIIAYQMLADFGYDGFTAYAGNKYGTDLKALQGVSNDETLTWKKYQLGRYEKVAENLKDNAYFDEKSLTEEVKQRIKNDISNGVQNSDTSSVVTLRKTIYGHLKRVTNDFRGEVFTNKTNKIHIKTADEFRSLLEKNPCGEFVLDNDIDMSKITDGTAVVRETFYGTLDGQGHKIIGNKIPIFNKLSYAYVKDLKLEGTNISGTGSYFGALVKVAANSNLTNITARNIKVSATVNEIGGLVGSTSGTYMKNVHIIEAEVSGAGRVGVLTGYGTNMTVESCSSNGTVSATGNAVGGFFGQFDNGSVNNSYAIGSASGNVDLGGFIGWSEGTQSIKNCYSKVNTKSNTRGPGGGFIGQIRGSGHIENCIALGNVKNSYKFDGRSANNMFGDNYKNNYEYEGARGTETASRSGIDFNGKIGVVTENELSNTSLYTNKLGWDASIWDLKNVTKGGLPKLKNSDPNNITSLIEEIEISSAKDFTKINNDPFGTYKLTKDIDLSSLTIDAGSAIITEDFAGKLEGNGHKISNARNVLFRNVNAGQIKNVIIENSNVTNNNSKGILANNIEGNATIENIYIKNSNLSNNTNGVGGLAGIITSSNINKISITDVNIKAGNTIGGLSGELRSSNVQNILVTGRIEATADRIGGVTGWLATGASIKYSVTKVEIVCNSTRLNGGIIGGPDQSSVIQNSISLSTGTSARRIAGGNALDGSNNVYEYALSNSVTNINDSNKEKVKVATEQNIKSKDFYVNQLELSETIWDFTSLSTGEGPKIK